MGKKASAVTIRRDTATDAHANRSAGGEVVIEQCARQRWSDVAANFRGSTLPIYFPLKKGGLE
jgi:hypothetical protein